MSVLKPSALWHPAIKRERPPSAKANLMVASISTLQARCGLFAGHP
jgi:hypothetical protein